MVKKKTLLVLFWLYECTVILYHSLLLRILLFYSNIVYSNKNKQWLYLYHKNKYFTVIVVIVSIHACRNNNCMINMYRKCFVKSCTKVFMYNYYSMINK